MDSIPWDLRRRGLKDSLRHDERVKEAIRRNLHHLIVEETIISSDGRRTVRIPIRYLEQYRFRYEREGEPRGVGHGKGRPGETVARRGEGRGGAEPRAGDLPGEEVYEAEVGVEELTEAMLEELDLPRLTASDAPRAAGEGIRFDDVRKVGAMNNLDKRRTLYENLKRQAAKGRPRLGPFVQEDLRFKVWSDDRTEKARAAVYMLMDRSASMDTEKRYIVKSFYFWLVRFLRLKYGEVDLVFVAHDAEAKIVSEEEFFTVASSGGTRCSTAYALALKTIRERHPAGRWNVYLFHFSDGENLPSDNPRVGELVRELVAICRMVGYGEVQYSGWAGFYQSQGRGEKRPPKPTSALHAELAKCDAPNLVLAAIDHKSEIYATLKRFLSKEGAA